MEELLKQIMGDSFKENMTQEELQGFFKNQVLSSGEYVNKGMADAEKLRLQNQLKDANEQLKNKMTDDEKKAAADQELQNQIEELKKQLLEGKKNQSELKANGITLKARQNAGIAEDDKEFAEFITSIISEDEAETSKIANYVNTIAEKAYEKGKTDATKNKLGAMGNLNQGGGNDGNEETGAEEIAKRLAKAATVGQSKNSYFK